MKRQVSGGGGANIEVLVKPAIRRNEKTRLMPRNNDLIASFRPHNRVSFPGRDHDQVAGPMAMPLFVSARWKNRHMGRDGRTGKPTQTTWPPPPLRSNVSSRSQALMSGKKLPNQIFLPLREPGSSRVMTLAAE